MISEDEYFKLKKDDKIYLYGTNQISVDAYYNMIKQGYNVKGIIDQRATFYQPMCINKKQFFFENKDNEKISIIICLNDGMKHEIVAEEIFENGIDKILFLPMQKELPFDLASHYRKSYSEFLDGEYDRIYIPIYKVYKKQRFEIIAENKNSVVFLCPYEYLRVDEIVERRNILNERVKNKIKRYVNCYIGEFDLYLDLFRFFAGENAKSDDYFIYQRNNEKDRKELMANKRELYLLFENKFKSNIQFFYDSPAMARWNDNGYCSVFDGLHRICFLYLKGINQFPVKIKKDDFYKMIEYFNNKKE